MVYSKKTRNKSFINMWHYLQRFNVENNIFMLGTLDKELSDFSIDKYLSYDREDPSFLLYKTRVINEVKNNIWFYFRELVFVPDKDNHGKFKHFELTPTTMLMIYLYNKSSYIVTENNDNVIYTNKFLWNYNRILFGNDLIITDDVYKTENVIKNDILLNIKKSPILSMIGFTQLIFNYNNIVLLNNEVLETCNNFNMKKMIDDIYNKHVSINNWIDNNGIIFNIDYSNDNKIFNYLIDISDSYKLYLLMKNYSNSDNKNICIMNDKTILYDNNDINEKVVYIIN